MKWGRILIAAGLVSVLWRSAAGAPTPLVNHGDAWRWRKGTSAPQANWRTVADGSLSNSWTVGNGGIGFGNDPGETSNCQTIVTDMLDNYTTLYMRREFTLAQAVDTNLILHLRVDCDDGYIAWLDGQYLASLNVSGAPTQPAYTATATALHESSLGNGTRQPVLIEDLGRVANRLGAGTHHLAIIGLNQSSNSADCIQVADLYAEVEPPFVTNTWALTNSPILVATNLTIERNSTLIIEPGVTVTLASGIGLVVADGGCLLAQGTTNAPIVFTRSGAAGNWGNITILGSAGSPETRIEHAHFAFNGGGGPCLAVSGATVYFAGLSFENRSLAYMELDDASCVVRDCEFPALTAALEPVHGSGGIKSGGHAIFYRNYFGPTHGYNDVVDFTGGQRPGPIVQFLDNVFMGSGDDGLDLDNTDAWVEGNIFMHMHKNGSPDTSSAVSGGNDTGTPSEVTVVGNLIFDCDQAGLAKQNNFFTFLDNTIVHQTHVGGTDSNVAVVCLQDGTAAEGKGMYLEGNLIVDAELLTQGVSNAIVTFTNNLMQLAWTGAGGDNLTNDAALEHIPEVAETTNFANWAEAQIMRAWLRPLPDSPARGAGPHGRNLGAPERLGAAISGEPPLHTNLRNATLFVGPHSSGSGIPATANGFPNGSGYTHYRYRLDGAIWSAETSNNAPIAITNLALGAHVVEVAGKRDCGNYQDDSIYGVDALVSTSRTWIVIDDADHDGMDDAWEQSHGLDNTRDDALEDIDHDGMSNRDEYLAGFDPDDAGSVLRLELGSGGPTGFVVRFEALSNHSYTVDGCESLPAWSDLFEFAASPQTQVQQWADPTSTNLPHRFYRLRTPATGP